MKVVELSTHFNDGGAGVAAYRLHKLERKANINSHLLVNDIVTPNDVSIDAPSSFLAKLEAFIKPYANSLMRRLILTSSIMFHSFNWFPDSVGKRIARYKPDLLHIHWIGGGFIRPESLKKISVPIVWTLHDVWPFSGACHHVCSEQRFFHGFNKNNRPQSESGLDLNYWLWQRKREMLDQLQITFVAPSHWIMDQAKNSYLGKNQRIVYIPNGIDISKFKVGDKLGLRNKWKISEKSKVILFAAHNPLLDKNKGIDKLIKAVSILPDIYKKNTIVIVAGSHVPTKSLFTKSGVSILDIGVVSDENTMIELYNISDITVVPSQVETLSYVTMESMACGTPCVSFDVGGVTDMIQHMDNGYLAKPYDISDLSRGINLILYNSSLRKKFERLSRKKIVQHFTELQMLHSYLSLYKKLLKSPR